MAIKIIKPGKKRIPIYGTKCGYCECEFEFNTEDVAFNKNTRLGQIECPNCDNTVTFSIIPKRYSIVK